MSSDDILQMIRRRPFTPFRLVTTDGTAYEIRHPEMVMPGRRTVTLGMPDNPALPIYDQQVIVSLLHVQHLESLDTAAPSGNGQ